MKEQLLIVEDEFIVANDLRILLTKAGYRVCAIADSVDSALAAIEKYKPSWVFLDVYLLDNSLGTTLAPILKQKGIGFIYISANTNQAVLQAAKATQPYGFMVKPFREKDLLIMLEIARNKHEAQQQFERQREMMLRQHLNALTDADPDFPALLPKLPGVFQSLLPFDMLCFRYFVQSTGVTSTGGFRRTGFAEYQSLDPSEEQALAASVSELKATAGNGIIQTNLFTEQQLKDIYTSEIQRQLIHRYGLSSVLQFFVATPHGRLGISFYSKQPEAFEYSHTALLNKSGEAIFQLFKQARAKSNPVAHRSQKQPVSPSKFEGIYGKSPALLRVLDEVELVANTPVSVLVLGESGTGKELVAHHIHQLSSRSAAPFVTVNCAALPADLIESELFGHEKGAFTGALDKRIGKFQMANGGTIFLDEIGEMPLDAQVKLLRVLQEKKFEPIGSTKTVHINIRIIAATNRNLEKEVAEGRFRLDLFYRLNVFPIELPSLRERKEDIPLLAAHFLVKCAGLIERAIIPKLSQQAIRQMSSYDWPGNIRELEHVIARTLIKTKQEVIDEVALSSSIPKAASADINSSNEKTLEQIETEHILSVLKRCNGKISGEGGAAQLLGVPASTLTSKMKKLGIKKELYFER